MITKKKLRIAKLTATPIEQYVIDELLRRFDDFNQIEDYIREIYEFSCVSGVVGSLIYYHDTLMFYEKYKEYINQFLYEMTQDTDTYNLSILFSRWDDTDPLALDIPNRNELAWFGFEQALIRVCYQLDIEI